MNFHRYVLPAVLSAMLAIHVGSFACGPEPGLFHYEYKIFRKETGLPCERIRCVWQADDLVFVGTDGGGLMVYQNETWKAYTPQTEPAFPGMAVGSIAPGDSGDNLLAGTNAGLVRIKISGNNLSFQLLPKGQGYSPNFLSLYKVENHWLAGTDREAGLLFGEDFTPFHLPPEIDETGFNCEFSADRNYFFGSSKGLFQLPRESTQLQKNTQADFGWVNALHGYGNFLILGGSKGFFRIGKEKVENLLPEVWITSLAGDPSVLDPKFEPPPEERHEFFVGTKENGLLLYHSGGRFYHFTMENSRLPSNSISALYAPPYATGSVWIGTPESGLVQRRHVTPSPGIFSPVPSLAVKYHDWLYAGTDGQGMAVFDPVSRELINQVTAETVSGFHRRVSAIEFDSSSRLWVAGDAGIWMKDTDGWHPYGVGDGLPARAIPLLFIRENHIYVAAPPEGSGTAFLATFNGTSFTPITPDTLELFWTRNKPSSKSERVDGPPPESMPIGLATPIATDSIAKLRRSFPRLRPTALYETPEFILLGCEDGRVMAFNGLAFSEWDLHGNSNKIIGISQLGDGQFVLATPEKIFLGRKDSFKELPPLMTDEAYEFHTLRVDDFKGTIIWAGFSSSKKTGVACFYQGKWELDPFGVVPAAICAAQPYLFIASEQGTMRALKITKPGYFRERDQLIVAPTAPPPTPAPSPEN